ncbi:MAG: hypothetical protein V4544_02570 [Pseudomonadota bacterium]
MTKILLALFAIASISTATFASDVATTTTTVDETTTTTTTIAG